MKFQLKALVAALSLVAVLPAQAAITTALSGDSSLVLTVYDTTANISAMFDLGRSYSDFSIAGASFPNSGITAAGTNLSWNLASGDYAPAWSQFLATATLPNIKYAVSAQDNLGIGAGNRGLITSYSALGANITTGQLNNIAANFDSYISNNNLGTSGVQFQNHQLVANGGSVAVSGGGYAPKYFIAGKNFNVGATAVGNIGTDLGVLQYTSAATTFVSPTVSIFGNGAKFNLAANGALSYSTTSVAPIPEADSWAMMLLGLGFMGFIARRKQS